MMKGIALFDMISLLASLSGIAALLFIGKERIKPDIRLLIIHLLLLLVLYYASLFIEWYGISDILEPFEDMIGALIPMMWAFVFYALIQKISNADLKESEKQVDMALKGTRAGLWDWNLVTGETVYNEEWAGILGYTLAELKPLNIDTWINSTHPDDLKKSKEMLQKHFDGETEFYECEMRMKHKFGHWIWIMDRGMVIERDKTGRPIRMIGTHIDISIQKQVEEELKEQIEENKTINKKYHEQNKELIYSIEQVKTINHELITAKEKAEESDRLKSAFMANMSHEIRTPMNGILGFAELLRNEDVSGSTQHEYINLIRESGNRMLNIINDLMDISRIEAGQLDLSYENTNVNDLLNELYLFFKPESVKRGLSFSFSTGLKHEEAIIKTDKTKIYQILSNLINNALKYTEKGEVNFGCSRSDDFIEFYVRDTGVGISPEFHEKIFERFRQVNLQASNAKEGSGLGLTISKAFIEKLGGKIGVQSKPGEGSLFRLSLPYNNPLKEKNLQHNDSFTGAVNYSDTTILVAEDDDVSYKYILELLMLANIKVLRAVNGQEAVDICRNHAEIRMVLMDIKMPVMSGFEAIQHIRQFRKNLPIIIESAYAMSEDKEKALQAGCNDYLSKPIKMEELFSILNKYITDKNR